MSRRQSSRVKSKDFTKLSPQEQKEQLDVQEGLIDAINTNHLSIANNAINGLAKESNTIRTIVELYKAYLYEITHSGFIDAAVSKYALGPLAFLKGLHVSIVPIYGLGVFYNWTKSYPIMHLEMEWKSLMGKIQREIPQTWTFDSTQLVRRTYRGDTLEKGKKLVSSVFVTSSTMCHGEIVASYFKDVLLKNEAAIHTVEVIAKGGNGVEQSIPIAFAVFSQDGTTLRLELVCTLIGASKESPISLSKWLIFHALNDYLKLRPTCPGDINLNPLPEDSPSPFRTIQLEATKPTLIRNYFLNYGFKLASSDGIPPESEVLFSTFVALTPAEMTNSIEAFIQKEDSPSIYYEGTYGWRMKIDLNNPASVDKLRMGYGEAAKNQVLLDTSKVSVMESQMGVYSVKSRLEERRCRYKARFF